MGTELYDTFINQARERGFLSKANANPFMPGAAISKYYDDYKALENTYAKSTGASPLEIADLRYSSKSNNMKKYSDTTDPITQYKSDEKALNFFKENSAFYSGPSEKNKYMNYINNDLERMKQMTEEDAANEYENKLSDTQKSALSLIGVKGIDGFKSMINAVQLNDDITNGDASIIKNPEGNTMVEYQGEQTMDAERDVDWGDVGKGALTGAAAGAAIGTLFGGVGAVPGYAIGAIIGTGLGLATEFLDMFSENEVVESVNDAKRNFVAAMYGSTIGMLGDATGGILNVVNTGIGWASGNDTAEIAANNPFNMIEGVTDGIDEWLINKQKNEYSGFSKFLVTDLMSVAGSLAGFAVMGNAFGKVFKGSEIGTEIMKEGVVGGAATATGKFTVGGSKVLGTLFGGAKEEIATRTVVALGAADNTYDEVKASGASDEDALVGSLITGGANFAVLAKTKAIPGILTKNAQIKAHGLGTAQIIKSLSMEMFTEAVEEIGEELSADLGKTYGTKTNSFKGVKDYAYIGFLGAIGGAFGAGIGTLNYAKVVNNEISRLKQFNETLVNEKVQEYKEQGMLEIQAKDKAVVWFNENGVGGIPVSVLRGLVVDKAEEYKIAFEETVKYAEETLRPKAEEILNRSTSLDNTLVNQNKIVGILLEADMQQDEVVKEKLETYPEAVAKMNTPENISTLLSLSNEDIEMIQQNSKSGANQLVEEFALRGYEEMYKDISNPKNASTENKALELATKYNLTSKKLTNLNQRQLITSETYIRLKEYVDGFNDTIEKSINNFLDNGERTSLSKALEIFTDDQLIDYLDTNKVSTEDRYKILDAMGKTAIDARTKNLGKTVKVLSSFARKVNSVKNKVANSKTAEDTTANVKSIRQDLNKLDDIKRELKAQYGSLKNVPWETINKLTDDNLTFEEFKQYEKDLKSQLRIEKANVSSRTASVDKYIKKSEPAFNFINEKEYYKSKRNKAVSLHDEMRADYHHSLTKAMMLGNMPEHIADKYDYNDYNHYLTQLTFRNPTIYKSLIGAEMNKKQLVYDDVKTREILQSSIYANIDEKYHEIISDSKKTGKGSSRVAFVMSDDRVAKIAMQKGAGMAQNSAEYTMYDEIKSYIEYEEKDIDNGIKDGSYAEAYVKSRTKQLVKLKKAEKHLAATYANINDGQVIISEKVNPYGDLDAEIILKALQDAGEVEKDVDIDEYGMNDYDYYIDRWLTKTFESVVDEFGFDLRDIWGSYSNLGVRDNGEVVILDYGFNDEIGFEYYTDYEFGEEISIKETTDLDLYTQAKEFKEENLEKIKELAAEINKLQKIRQADKFYDERVQEAKDNMFSNPTDGFIESEIASEFTNYSTDALDWYSKDYSFREMMNRDYINTINNGLELDIPVVYNYEYTIDGKTELDIGITFDGMAKALAQRIVGKEEVDFVKKDAGLKELLQNPMATLNKQSDSFKWLDFEEQSDWMNAIGAMENILSTIDRLQKIAQNGKGNIGATYVLDSLNSWEKTISEYKISTTEDGKTVVGDLDNGYFSADELSDMYDEYLGFLSTLEDGMTATEPGRIIEKPIAEVRRNTDEFIKNNIMSNMNDVTKVRNAVTNTEVIGLGIDWTDGNRKITVYEHGEEMGKHQYFYDKEALILEILRDNNDKTMQDENGNEIKCEV